MNLGLSCSEMDFFFLLICVSSFHLSISFYNVFHNFKPEQAKSSISYSGASYSGASLFNSLP